MKRILATMLALVLLLGAAGYSETLGTLMLPNTLNLFGAAVNGGYTEIATDFAGYYLLFDPVTADSIDAYRVRMAELGFVEEEGEQDGALLWLYYFNDAPVLLLAYFDDEAMLCYQDGVAFLEEGTVDAQTWSDSTDMTYPELDLYSLFGTDYYGYDANDSYSYTPQQTICVSCYGSGTCPLCNGTGTYSNYGYSSDCSCDDGVCSICGGAGYY
jgi:hypothetical protein